MDRLFRHAVCMMAIALVLGAGARDFVHPGIAESAEDIARATNTISYEITCGISKRVPRVYIE